MDAIDIRKKVCKYYQISISDFVGRSRKRELAIAREMFAYLTYPSLNISARLVGVYMGNRDSATVFNCLNRFKDDFCTNANFRDEYAELLELINE